MLELLSMISAIITALCCGIIFSDYRNRRRLEAVMEKERLRLKREIEQLQEFHNRTAKEFKELQSKVSAHGMMLSTKNVKEKQAQPFRGY